MRLIANSFHCRYATAAKNSKDGERLKERGTQQNRGTRKLIHEFPSCTCQRGIALWMKHYEVLKVSQ